MCVCMSMLFYVCKCVSVLECKLCHIVSVVIQRAKRKTSVSLVL